MIRFVEIGSDEKPKKGSAAVEAKAAAPVADLATSSPKPAKRAKKPSSLSKAAKR
jgi:hypothetical protein